MASRPRLYARSRVEKINSSVSSSPKPDVLILINTKPDSKVIINLLKKEPILCQVIELSSIDSLDHYYQSHNDNTDQIVYLVQSVSFAKQIGKLTKKRKDFYTIPTCSYTLYPYKDFRNNNGDFCNFNDPEELAKSLRTYFNSLLTTVDVELSSQSVSTQTPYFAWFQFMFALLSRLERSDIS
jgi:hypothetical protein